MARGYLALVLHTHLPFVRHPEHNTPLEERWLHEAISECYLPILGVFERLYRDGVPFALTMSLTPPLAAMLEDPLLQKRFEDHLERLIALAESERKRVTGDPEFEPVVAYYQDRFAALKRRWKAIDGRVVQALLGWQERGYVDLIACSATHAYLPGYLPCPAASRAQIQLGMGGFQHLVGLPAQGMWLPECAYHPSFDEELASAGVRYTILDSHGLTDGQPKPPFGVYQPIISPNGIAFFGRDPHSSRQVWSREGGIPGNPVYRDFYRDIGFDLTEEELLGEVGPYGARIMTGLKYYAITSKSPKKLPYQPRLAERQAFLDGGTFVADRRSQLSKLSQSMPVTPIVVSPYDTELFGHWWFEGPLFLESVFRHVANHQQRGDTGLEAITLREYLRRHPHAFGATPSPSSWGAGGYGEVWVGKHTGHLWRHLHHATRQVESLVNSYPYLQGRRGQALDLAIVELLLAQSSDFPFILKTDSVPEYAEARVRAHLNRLRKLTGIIVGDDTSSESLTWMANLATRDNFLHDYPRNELRRPYLEKGARLRPP